MFVDIPPIFFSCPADHVPDWQPRILMGMVEARSVNVKNTHTHERERRQLLIFIIVSSASRKTRRLCEIAVSCIMHYAEDQSPGTGGEEQDWGGRRRGEEVEKTPKESRTPCGNGGRHGRKEKKTTDKRVLVQSTHSTHTGGLGLYHSGLEREHHLRLVVEIEIDR